MVSEGIPGGAQRVSLDEVRSLDVLKDTTKLLESGKMAEDYSHIYRRKTFCELVRLSAAECGLELAYAAETAFVSPSLLLMGVGHQQMSLVWALSPLAGFFVTPLLGSLSDRCKLRWGRRRPFILLLAAAVLAGLLFIPNGSAIGYALGDVKSTPSSRGTVEDFNSSAPETQWTLNDNWTIAIEDSDTSGQQAPTRWWGILFMVIGTVLLDFGCDACQSPARAYLLDVTVEEDHGRALSTFTVLAGLGCFLGYLLGAIDWDNTVIGPLFGGHMCAVFSLVTAIFVVCIVYTVTSFKEIPYDELQGEDRRNQMSAENLRFAIEVGGSNYGSIDTSPLTKSLPVFHSPREEIGSSGRGLVRGHTFSHRRKTVLSRTQSLDTDCQPSLRDHLLSIVFMPRALRLLCLTNLLCWMAHLTYCIYFTDFVAEAVFGGDPLADEGSVAFDLYQEGVRFGCWGMALYSLTCALYSLFIERIINRFRALPVYVGGLLGFCCSMAVLAFWRTRVGVILCSAVAGTLYATLYTLPYMLVARYHTTGEFATSGPGDAAPRGLGTDVAVVSSTPFLAQFFLCLCTGSIVTAAGSAAAVVAAAAFLALCGAVAASQVTYLDL